MIHYPLIGFNKIKRKNSNYTLKFLIILLNSPLSELHSHGCKYPYPFIYLLNKFVLCVFIVAWDCDKINLNVTFSQLRVFLFSFKSALRNFLKLLLFFVKLLYSFPYVESFCSFVL